VSAVRPERTDLATGICVFEFLAGCMPLATLVLLGVIRQQTLTNRPNVAMHPLPAILGFVSIFSAALTFAAAIALWQMRRAAFYLFAVKFAISLYQYLRLLFRVPAAVTLHSHRPTPITPDQIRTIGLLVSLAGVIFLGAITWYTYVATKPCILPDESNEQV